jgi:LPS export ABC transporter protein LptC
MEGKTVKWELEANSARFDENLRTFEKLKMKFYPENKRPFTIEADNGIVKENVPLENATANKVAKDEIYLKNNVLIIGYVDSTIKCDSLLWDSASEIMRSEDKVEIEGGKWNIKGEGIEFSPDGDIITIKKDVAMEITGR